jgi:molybdenum cofactor sulfurtransferase
MVSTMGGQTWHRSKGLGGPDYKLHEGLEDGTLPFHSILALGEAIDVQQQLYGSMKTISLHTSYLIYRLYSGLVGLIHGNGRPVCRIYAENGGASFGDPITQGPSIAFNVTRANGRYVPYSDVEGRANAAGIYIRSGGTFCCNCLRRQRCLTSLPTGVCNPGGIFSALGYEPWMAERALSAGHHCGSSDSTAVIHNRPTG